MLPDSSAKSQTKQSHMHGSVPANPGLQEWLPAWALGFPLLTPDLEHLGSEGVGKIIGEEAFVHWVLGGDGKQSPKEALPCPVTLSLASEKVAAVILRVHRTSLRHSGCSAGDARAEASVQALLP